MCLAWDFLWCIMLNRIVWQWILDTIKMNRYRHHNFVENHISWCWLKPSTVAWLSLRCYITTFQRCFHPITFMINCFIANKSEQDLEFVILKNWTFLRTLLPKRSKMKQFHNFLLWMDGIKHKNSENRMRSKIWNSFRICSHDVWFY